MQKTQNFSCLFRHYAKHNGLRKEGREIRIKLEVNLSLIPFLLDLVFSFVDELLNEQTPEVVHLMPQGLLSHFSIVVLLV